MHCNLRLSDVTTLHQQGCNLSDFHGGSEFPLATSDYSGHGGCQIGTVE